MPHGESWFSFLPFLESLSHWASETFGPSYMEHNPHLGVQHVLAYGTVVLFLILGYIAYGRARLAPYESETAAA